MIITLLLALVSFLSYGVLILAGLDAWALTLIFLGFGLVLGMEIQRLFPDAPGPLSRPSMPHVSPWYMHEVDWLSDGQTPHDKR